MNISDEMYVSQKNWDLSQKNIGAFKDDIFARTSVYKNRNYIDLYECRYAQIQPQFMKNTLIFKVTFLLASDR